MEQTVFRNDSIQNSDAGELPRRKHTSAFSLNGHDSSYIMSAKKAVLKVPILGCKTTNMQLTDFHNPAGQNTNPVFLF
jgi:hypothetical protein